MSSVSVNPLNWALRLILQSLQVQLLKIARFGLDGGNRSVTCQLTATNTDYIHIVVLSFVHADADSARSLGSEALTSVVLTTDMWLNLDLCRHGGLSPINHGALEALV